MSTWNGAQIISYAGSGLSIVGLTITVLLYGLFRNLRRDRGGKILLNLSASLLAMHCAFIVASALGSMRYNDRKRTSFEVSKKTDAQHARSVHSHTIQLRFWWFSWNVVGRLSSDQFSSDRRSIMSTWFHFWGEIARYGIALWKMLF